MVFQECIKQIDSSLLSESFAIKIGKKGQLLILNNKNTPISSIPKEEAISLYGKVYKAVTAAGGYSQINKFGFAYDFCDCAQYVASKLVNLIKKDGLHCGCNAHPFAKNPLMYKVTVSFFSYSVSFDINVAPCMSDDNDRHSFCEKALSVAISTLKRLKLDQNLIKDDLKNQIKKDLLLSAVEGLANEGFDEPRLSTNANTISFTFNEMICHAKTPNTNKCFGDMFIAQEKESYKYINIPRFSAKFRDNISEQGFVSDLTSYIAKHIRQQEKFLVASSVNISSAVRVKEEKARKEYNKKASLLLVGAKHKKIANNPVIYVIPKNNIFLYDYGCFSVRYNKEKDSAVLNWSESAKSAMMGSPEEERAKAMINKFFKDTNVGICPAERKFKGLLSSGERKVTVQYYNFQSTFKIQSVDCRSLDEWEQSVIVPIKNAIDNLKEKYVAEIRKTEERMTVFKNSFLSAAIYGIVKANEQCITANAVADLLRGTKIFLNITPVKTPECGTMNAISKEDIVGEIDHMFHEGLLNQILRKGEFAKYYLLKCNMAYTYEINPPKKLSATAVNRLRAAGQKLSDVESESLVLYFKNQNALKPGDYMLMLKLLSDRFMILRTETAAEVFKDCPDEVRDFILMKIETLDDKHLIKAYKALVSDK